MNQEQRVAAALMQRTAMELPPTEGKLPVEVKHQYLEALGNHQVFAGEAMRAAKRSGDEEGAQRWSLVWEKLQEAIDIVKGT